MSSSGSNLHVLMGFLVKPAYIAHCLRVDTLVTFIFPRWGAPSTSRLSVLAVLVDGHTSG